SSRARPRPLPRVLPRLQAPPSARPAPPGRPVYPPDAGRQSGEPLTARTASRVAPAVSPAMGGDIKGLYSRRRARSGRPPPAAPALRRERGAGVRRARRGGARIGRGSDDG